MLADANQRIPILMHDIARRVRYRFDARARRLGVTRAQWRVLMMLSRVDGPTQSDLAELIDVERITLCRMVDRLAEADMVERRADPTDRRVWRLHLTAKAMPLVSELSAMGLEVEDEMLEPLTLDQRKTLAALLGQVRSHMLDLDDSTEPRRTGTARS